MKNVKNGGMLLTCLLTLMLMQPATAADINEDLAPEEIVTQNRNGFSFAPYFWMTGFHGDMTVNGQTLDMTGVHLFDLLDEGHIRFPPMVAFMEWDWGQYGFYFDGTLAGLEFGASNIELGPGPFTAQFGLDFTYGLVNTGFVFDLGDFQANGFQNEFDALAGIRYTYYDIDLDASIGPIPISLDETIHWVDGTVGVRLAGQNDNGITYSLFGDVGVGSGFSAQGLATIGKTWDMGNYDLNVFAGYRYLYQDYSNDDDGVDLASHGPLVGLKLKF